MDDCMGRKTATGVFFTKGGCSITLEKQKHHDRNTRYCSRLGCCASLYSMKSTNRAEEKSSFRSGSSKSLLFSSGRSNEENDEAESSHRQGDNHKLKCSDKYLDKKDSVSERRLDKKEKSHAIGLRPFVESAKVHRFSENATGELGSCRTRLSSSTRASSEVIKQPRYCYRENSGATVSNSDASNFLSSGFHYAGSGIGRIDSENRKRSYRRGSSSSMDKSVISPRSRANSGSSSTGTSDLNTSLPEHLSSHQAPRRPRNISIRTRQALGQAPSSNTIRRGLGQEDAPIFVQNPLTMTQQSPNESGAVSQSSRSSRDCHTSYRNLRGQSRARAQRAQNRLIDEAISNGITILDDTSEPSDDYLNLNTASVAQMLLELERIEQDEGLSFLGNHLFMESLGFHDQYRDMRMDIDDMTYEELLALGERMGTVSTALTEEALDRCLKRSNYMLGPLIPGISGPVEGDVKCSICQEDYVTGDELGKLSCEHFYHLKCINQWLRLKNWCPICKASAFPTS